MNVNLFPMLPRDITKVILEQTGGLEHVDKIKVLKEGIYFKSICNYLDSLPIYEWFEHITFEESIEYMNMFTRCNCCNRHKKKRPTTQMFMEGCIMEQWAEKDTREKKCNCKCRHLSRTMCEERNNVEDEFYMWVHN